jgi:hypothetical protein
MYGIRLPGAILYLQQWDSTLNLDQQIGKPLKQKTKQLDVNSDTYAGSFTKELEYHGLKLKLFSPPSKREILLDPGNHSNRQIQNNQEYWYWRRI